MGDIEALITIPIKMNQDHDQGRYLKLGNLFVPTRN